MQGSWYIQTSKVEVFMKGLSAKRVKIKIGNLWQPPILHILLTEEDGVIVARCLDFTVSSHGDNEEDAIIALAGAIKEYILAAIEQDAINLIYDPASPKYWRMFNEIEARRSVTTLKRSINKTLKDFNFEVIQKSTPEIIYA
jgi:hypothetical protein